MHDYTGITPAAHRARVLVAKGRAPDARGLVASVLAVVEREADVAGIGEAAA